MAEMSTVVSGQWVGPATRSNRRGAAPPGLSMLSAQSRIAVWRSRSADAVALASDLLLTARARLGRLLECPAIESWRALVSLGTRSAVDQPKPAKLESTRLWCGCRGIWPMNVSALLFVGAIVLAISVLFGAP
jgi:hypothetical protein